MRCSCTPSILIRWLIPQCLAFLAAGWCDRAAASGGAPERVHTAERPFGFHGSAGQQQSTEGEVFDCDHQHYTFNFWKDAFGTSEDLRTKSKLCFIDSVSNYLIGCFGKLFRTSPTRGYLWVREKRRLSWLNETLYRSAIYCTVSLSHVASGVNFWSDIIWF